MLGLLPSFSATWILQHDFYIFWGIQSLGKRRYNIQFNQLTVLELVGFLLDLVTLFVNLKVIFCVKTLFI